MIKRLSDLMFALFCLVTTAPLILVIAIFIKLDSSGPVLYMLQMVGKNGKLFRLFRFRTMYVDRPSYLRPEDQFTRVGRFIRNYSLDHLPTLINVLKGDISVVGPRPMEPEFVDLQDPTWQRYFRIRPGFISYAILKLGKTFGPSSAGNLPLKQELELEYIQKRSPAFDLQLFLKSVWAHVVSGGNVKARGKPDPALEDKVSWAELATANSKKEANPGESTL